MKILLLTTHLDMGGIPVYVISLARGLRDLGHRPFVVSSGGWLERRLRQDRIPHMRVWFRTSSELNPRIWFTTLPQLLRIVRREKPDLIHAHTRVAQVLAWGLHMLTGIPFVTTCHGLYKFRIGRRFFRCWGKTVMAISGPSMERLVDQYRLAPPHQVVLVRNGIQLDRFTRAVSEAETREFKMLHGLNGGPVIGGIARLSPVKGFDYLLRAVPALLRKFPTLKVLLVGGGPSRAELIRLSYELKIADRVVIVHPIDDTRVPLAVMDVFTAPALQEGFGLSIVEAMAAGVAVVSSDAGGPAEIIQHGRNGLLVPPGDHVKLGEAIGSLLADPGARARIAEQGKLRAADFDIQRVVHEVEAVYADAVKGKAG